jgi:preprotein translocase subunit YajC
MNNSDIAQIRLFLAQDGGAAAPPPAGETGTIGVDPSLPAPTGQQPQSFPTWLLILPIALLVFMMIFSGGAQKKERRRRAEMLSALAKHDKVQTVGGVIGTVVEIKDSEVILKVDETTNTKMRFAKSAVQRVLADNTPVEVG